MVRTRWCLRCRTSIAWLLNIRGSDVAHNPVALAFAIVPASGKPELFIDPAKIGREARRIWRRWPNSAIRRGCERGSTALKDAGKRVRLDPQQRRMLVLPQASAAARRRIVRGRRSLHAPKARKNAAEIKGARAAHNRDGAAMVRFLAWLDREAAQGRLDEIDGVPQLETIRGAKRRH